jgi:hypothetical protein
LGVDDFRPCLRCGKPDVVDEEKISVVSILRGRRALDGIQEKRVAG